VKEVDISVVDTSGISAAASAVGMEPRMHVDSSQTYPTSGGNGVANQQEITQVVEKMQERIDSMNVSLQYSTYGVHGEKIAIAVVNKETGELIREIPPEELRSLYVKMSELAGVIFNREI
jgi:flagellar protein FlaG